MSSDSFRFKQFEVFHDRCAMKVGMDGVSLGAWACLPDGADLVDTPILDIGTGSGLIALMLAQKYPLAQIDAVEIDSEAAAQAAENVQRSPWSGQIKVHCASFPEVLSGGSLSKAAGGYRLAVCNPPFFKGELRPADAGRNRARHLGCLQFSSLLQGVAACLHPEGVFSLILPYSEAESFDNLAYSYRLYTQRACALVPVQGRPPKRILLSYGRQRDTFVREELVIRSQDGEYTPEYQQLTSEYYL